MTIVVAIDFSKGSLHALNYAINLANKFNANVHMVWVDNVFSEELVYNQFSNKDKLEQKKNFEKLSKDKGKLMKKGKLGFSMRKGKVHIELAKVARSQDADLIVAGTHGVTGYESYWIGSNAYRIVSYAPCPVITIRSDYECCNEIKSILFPVDSSVETKQKLPFTVNIAKTFGSVIHLLGLYSTNLKSVRSRIDKHIEAAAKYFEENGVKYELEKHQPDNITKYILDFADKKKVNLIAIMTDQENTIDHVFLGQHAQQLISHSDKPILSLKSKEVISKHGLN